MQIDYTNTFDDVLAFARHHYGSSNGIQRNVRVQRFGGVAILGGYFLGLGCFSGSLFYFFVGAVTAVAWWVWIPRVLMNSYERQVARTYDGHKNHGTFGPHRLDLTDDHLAESNKFGESKVKWPAVERIESNEGRTFIYLSSAHAHIIPKDQVFSGDYDQFISAAQTAFSGAPAVAE